MTDFIKERKSKDKTKDQKEDKLIRIKRVNDA